MEIHSLNSKTPSATDVLALDTGSDTYKATGTAVVENAAPTYTSGDAASPTSWTDVTVLSSGLSVKTLLNRISTMIKNVRWLYSKLGTTELGTTATTITGAIAEHESDISTLNSKTTSYLLSASVSSQSFTAGEIRAIQFTLTVPAGFRVISISDVSNFAYLIGVPITWGLGDGQVTVYMNYFANTALTNRNLSIRAYAVKV